MSEPPEKREPGAGRRPGLDWEPTFNAYSALSLIELQLTILQEGVAALKGKLATAILASGRGEEAER